MPALSRTNYLPLLHTVKGKQHASRDDHDEEQDVERGGALGARKLSEAEITADPISSSDEEASTVPPGRPSSPTNAHSSRPSKRSTPRENQLINSKPTRRSQRDIKVKAPQTGAYRRGRAEKQRNGSQDEEKENHEWSPPPSAGKKTVKEDEEADVSFGWEFSSRKRQRVAAASNIHVPQSKAKTFSRKEVAVGPDTSKEQSDAWKYEPFMGLQKYANRTNLPPPQESDDNSDLSGSELQPLPEAITMLNKNNGRKAKSSEAEPLPTKSEPTSLLGTLGLYKQKPKPTNSQRSMTHATTLPNLDLNTSDTSTPLSSLDSANLGSPPGETLEHLEDYIRDLPAGLSDDRCPVCEQPVEQEFYWEWWKGRKRTVRQQSLFCREHNKREAIVEYKKKGYPEVDWDSLPRRIEKHHPRLIAILRDQTDNPSHYRELQRQKMEAGERPNVQQIMEQGADLETTTGYYGSRGRRAMMEAITNQLSDVIGDCLVEDRLVGYLGMANFVLRVLVPELTVLLVMDDWKVSAKMAKQVIEASGEVGAVVNEEVEDEVEREGSDAEDGGEEQHEEAQEE